MKKILWFCISVLLMYTAVGCGRAGKMPEGLIRQDVEEDEDAKPLIAEDENESNGSNSISSVRQNISLYFWDRESNKLVCESQNITILDMELFVDEVIAALIRGPQSEGLQPVIPRGTKVITSEKVDNIISVNLSKEFLEAEDL